MAVRRKQDKQSAIQLQKYQPAEVTYRFRSAEKNSTVKAAKASRSTISLSAFTQVFPYDVSLLYADLVKTATLATVMIVTLIVIWRTGVIH